MRWAHSSRSRRNRARQRRRVCNAANRYLSTDGRGERGRVTKGRSLSRRCYVCSHPRFIGNTWTRSKDRVFLCLLFLSGFRPFISPTSDRGNWRGGGGFAIHVSNDRCEILLFFAVWNGILLRQFDRIDGKVLFGVTFKINLDFSFF